MTRLLLIIALMLAAIVSAVPAKALEGSVGPNHAQHCKDMDKASPDADGGDTQRDVKDASKCCVMAMSTAKDGPGGSALPDFSDGLRYALTAVSITPAGFWGIDPPPPRAG